MGTISTVGIAEREARARAVEDATHSSAMEGFTATDAYRIDAAAYVDGEFDIDELIRRTRARYGLV